MDDRLRLRASSLRSFDVRSEKVVAGIGVERKTFCLDELELFLVKKLLSGGRLRALSALNRDRFLPCPSPPDPARVLMLELRCLFSLVVSCSGLVHVVSIGNPLLFVVQVENINDQVHRR